MEHTLLYTLPQEDLVTLFHGRVISKTALLGPGNVDVDFVLDVTQVEHGCTLQVEIETHEGIRRFRPTTRPAYEAFRWPGAHGFAQARFKHFHDTGFREGEPLTRFIVSVRSTKGIPNA